MNVMNYLDYNRIENVRKSMSVNNIDGVVLKKQAQNKPENTTPQQQQDFQIQENRRRLLSTEDVIDFAVNSDMKTDKELIGSERSLENLDITKAISDMQKDSILKEYQVFVQNPVSDVLDTEDGIIIKKR